jgi:hypothetical protein
MAKRGLRAQVTLEDEAWIRVELCASRNKYPKKKLVAIFTRHAAALQWSFEQRGHWVVITPLPSGFLTPRELVAQLPQIAAILDELHASFGVANARGGNSVSFAYAPPHPSRVDLQQRKMALQFNEFLGLEFPMSKRILLEDHNRRLAMTLFRHCIADDLLLQTGFKGMINRLPVIGHYRRRKFSAIARKMCGLPPTSA